MSASRWRVLPALGLLLAVVLTGCGGPKIVKVKGKLTYQGQPLQVSNKTYVTITFAPVSDNAGQTHPAKFTHADATFSVSMPPGKYRVGLLVAEPGGNPPISSPIDASQTYEILKDQELVLKLDRQSEGQDK
jgi:hypothetical protein